MRTIIDDVIRLQLFPVSLRGSEYRWLTSLAPVSIKIWNDMVEKFLGQYFLPSKAAKIRQEISTFMQGEFDTLFEAHERFNDLLRQ